MNLLQNILKELGLAVPPGQQGIFRKDRCKEAQVNLGSVGFDIWDRGQDAWVSC